MYADKKNCNTVVNVYCNACQSNWLCNHKTITTISIKYWKQRMSTILRNQTLKTSLLPFITGFTPLATDSPLNLLLNTLLPSRWAVALFVISTPAACPSKIRLRRNVGLLDVLINNPLCALRNMSFSSKIPVGKNK